MKGTLKTIECDQNKQKIIKKQKAKGQLLMKGVVECQKEEEEDKKESVLVRRKRTSKKDVFFSTTES